MNLNTYIWKCIKFILRHEWKHYLKDDSKWKYKQLKQTMRKQMKTNMKTLFHGNKMKDFIWIACKFIVWVSLNWHLFAGNNTWLSGLWGLDHQGCNINYIPWDFLSSKQFSMFSSILSNQIKKQKGWSMNTPDNFTNIHLQHLKQNDINMNFS